MGSGWKKKHGGTLRLCGGREHPRALVARPAVLRLRTKALRAQGWARNPYHTPGPHTPHIRKPQCVNPWPAHAPYKV